MSTRSGRLVKVKHSPDVDIINRSAGSHEKLNKSLTTPTTDKGRSPKSNYIEEKSRKLSSLGLQQNVIKDEPQSKSPASSGVSKSKTPKPSKSIVPKTASSDDRTANLTSQSMREKVGKSPVAPLLSQEDKDTSKETSAASPTVRRSSRAPVPSSRYKDMELDLGRVKKRSYSTVADGESETQSAKKSRKVSDKTATNKEDTVNNSALTNTDEPSEVHPDAVVLVDSSEPFIIDNVIQSDLTGADLQTERENVKGISSGSLEILMASDSEQSSQKLSSAPSHTQASELCEDTHGAAPSDFSSIKIGGQQLTFTEKDEETVAVVTIPASSAKSEAAHEQKTIDSSYQVHSIPVEILDAEKAKRTFSDLVTVSPTPHSLVHGHVLKKELQETPFATVVGQDGATYLNLTVEATKISSILKSKNAATVTKSNNPLKGHGRVLRNPGGSMIVKTTLVSPRSSQEAQVVVPAVTYSLLHSKKSEVDDSTSLAPAQNTVAVPVSVKSSQGNQSPHKVVVIKQEPSQAAESSLASIPQVAAEVPTESTLTIIHYSQEPAPCVPKTASEILLQKLKQQPKPADVEEAVHTSQDTAQEPSSNIGTDDTETDGIVHELQTTIQQSVSQTSEHIDTSQTEINEMTQSSDHETVNEDSDKTTASSIDNQNDIHFSEVKVETSDASLSKDFSADFAISESSRAASGDVGTFTGQAQPQSHPVDRVISEGDLVVSDDSQTPTSSTALSALKGTDEKDSKAGISAESHPVSAEASSAGQETEIVDLSSSSGISSLATSAVAKDKDRFEKIRVVDNGVEYDVRIVSEEEVAEEIVDNAASQVLQDEPKQSEASSAEVEPDIVKQEVVDDTEDIKPEVEKHTSGTQTVYSPHAQSTAGQTGAGTTTTHTLTTVVDEGSEKKHVYYVSVIPNKGIMAKTKTSMYSNAASWVIDDNGMYCCEKCDYQTDRKANFYKHRRSHTGAKPHVCPVCQYKAGTSSNLKRHMGIHKDIREHKCDICGLCFRQKIHLERHIKYKHEEKSIKCPMCDYICANEQPDLKMHIKRKHSNENSGEMVTCPECKVQVGNRKDLKQHMKFHKDGPELKLFCKECSFVTDCQSRLKRHTAIHSKMKPFQCGVCSYRAAQKEHVLRHLRTQHKIDIKRDSKRPWRRHKKALTEDGTKERADFTSGDKIFACNHCSMRFAKLINLYKHLHTQHGDIMPAETDGSFYCVVCEFSTTNKKNLLVHMRRHNMTDQTPPTHVYSCVLCRYVNPRRRNLFQHMRKKHNINISRQTENAEGEEDGDEAELEVSGVIGPVTRVLTPNNGNTISASTEASQNSSREMTEDLTDVASVIKIEDLTRMSNGEHDEIQTLVIDTRGGSVTDVVHTTAHTAEALEGLQALAEQAGLVDSTIEEQVPAVDEQQTVVFEQNSSTAEVVGTVETVGGQFDHIIQSAAVLASTSGESAEDLELSEEQLSSLRNGDMVEMDGHLYLVELTQLPNNPHKQMLSFLPISTASVSQDAHG